MMMRLIAIAMAALFATHAVAEEQRPAIWAAEASSEANGKTLWMYVRIQGNARDHAVDFPIADPNCNGRKGMIVQKVWINDDEIKMTGGCIAPGFFALVPAPEDQKTVLKYFYRKKYVVIKINDEQSFKFTANGVVKAINTGK